MCGIAGAAWTDPDLAIGPDVLSRMTDVLVHRGPDDGGQSQRDALVEPPYPAVPGYALGHTRLAIIDPTGSRQPMTNEDGSLQLVFNGEIYNYQELRLRLEASGHRFQTAGDTEVLVHLYEDEGIGFLDHLVGMFSLALWDSRQRRLVLARDRLGQKPLVYRQEPGRVLFASEIKSILQVPGMSRTVDASAIDEYLLYQYVPHPNTIFQGIRKLPPAHYALFYDGQLTVKRYWQWNRSDVTPTQRFNNEAAAADQLQTALSEAVRIRLRSDVPLGVFLSGGVDSSVIAALTQQQAGRRVRTFAMGFTEPEYDETSHARQVAQYLGTDHTELCTDPAGVEVLPKLVWHFDEPFADSSAIPTFLLAQATRDHVKVALSGDGGDELFLGYARYRAMAWGEAFDRWPRPIRALAVSPWWQRIPVPGRQKSLARRVQRLAEVLGQTAELRYAELVGIFNEQRRAALYHEDFIAQLTDSDPAGFLATALAEAGHRTAGEQAALADLVTYLPGDLCHKIDMATMAHGLECRQPMLDHHVVELAVNLPTAMKRPGKQMLQRAFGHLLPRGVFRRRKMGFGVPLDHWLRGPLHDLAHDALLSRRALERGYFRPSAIEHLLAAHSSGRFDHSARIWALLVLELWHREWVDQDQPVN